ncbi:ArsR/SmtB family transcription factor [Actinoplanes sp. NPDC049265]|uniref:ArsR/SmtB family transcription factor n=1 Tax=Actinoplanes sp. NPDC049265 TaxID=3363902 RepID=UPI003719396F
MPGSSMDTPSRTDAPAWQPITRSALDAEQATAFAPMFKALGDPVRLRLLSMIASAGGGEVCVCDLTGSFALTGPTISHHLKVLREAGLVDSDRRGTWVYYRLVPAAITLMAGLIAITDVVGVTV